MQGVQKVKCTSCGTTFMSETDTNTCPTCSQNHGHAHKDLGGCVVDIATNTFFVNLKYLL